MTNRNKTIFSPLWCSATLALAGCSQQVSNMKRGFLLTTEQEPKQEEQFPSSSQSQERAMQAKDPAVIFNYIEKEIEKELDDIGELTIFLAYHLFTEALKRAASVAENEAIAQAFHKTANTFHQVTIEYCNNKQSLFGMVVSDKYCSELQCQGERFQKAVAASSTVNTLRAAATEFKLLEKRIENSELMRGLETICGQRPFQAPNEEECELLAEQRRKKLKMALQCAFEETEKAFNLAAGITNNIKIQKHFKQAAVASSVACSKVACSKFTGGPPSDEIFSSLKEVTVAAAKAYEPTST